MFLIKAQKRRNTFVLRVFLTQSKGKSANFNHGLDFYSLPKRRGLENDFIIASSATSTEEIWSGVGNPVYPPAKAVLESHGIDPSEKRAVQLKASDYNKYDLFIGMDSANIRNITRILGGNKDGKIHKLMEYTGSNADVSDPWYTRDFDRCYKDICVGCEALLDSFNIDQIENRYLHIDFQSDI